MSFRVQLTNDLIKTPEQIKEEEKVRKERDPATAQQKYVYKKGKDGKIHKYRVKKKGAKVSSKTLPIPVPVSSGPRIHNISSKDVAQDYL